MRGSLSKITLEFTKTLSFLEMKNFTSRYLKQHATGTLPMIATQKGTSNDGHTWRVKTWLKRSRHRQTFLIFWNPNASSGQIPRPLSDWKSLHLPWRDAQASPQTTPGADVFNNNVVRVATIKSWETEFVGSHVTVLHDTLCNYMTKASLYARVMSHVQSSGTGKSRAHDELAKRLLYIPLNLAGPLATSMPPLSAYSSCFAHVFCFTFPPRDLKLEHCLFQKTLAASSWRQTVLGQYGCLRVLRT